MYAWGKGTAMNASRVRKQLRWELRLVRQIIRNFEAIRIIRRTDIGAFLKTLRLRRTELQQTISTLEKLRASKGGAPPGRRRAA